MSSIELSVELDDYYGVNAWYNLTDVLGVYIAEGDNGRLCVRVDYGRDYYTDIFINEAFFTEPGRRFEVLTTIVKELSECFQYHGVDGEKHRILSNDIDAKYTVLGEEGSL